MPRIDLATAPTLHGSSYPEPFDAPCRERHVVRLGQAAGLTRLGVSLVTLPPGAWSSQRHWHEEEDELLYVLSGALVLVDDAGETALEPGDCVGWKAGVPNGHHIQNRSDAPATFIVASNRDDNDHGAYSDIDLLFGAGRYAGKGVYRHKDGTPYEKRR